jgi:antitoxin CptB
MSDRDRRLKRLKIRSWRRGTKEMDLILGAFFDARGAMLDTSDLDAYEALLAENDQDLYQWVSDQSAAPAPHHRILAAIRAHHDIAKV